MTAYACLIIWSLLMTALVAIIAAFFIADMRLANYRPMRKGVKR